MKIAIKYYAQYDNFSCGCICVKMLLERLWIKKTRDQLKGNMNPEPGIWVDNSEIVDEFKRYGLFTKETIDSSVDDIVNYLENWYPVLVNYMNPLMYHGHYGIITGYSKEEWVFYFADPKNGQDFCLSFSDFDNLWHDTAVQIKKWLLIVGREKFILTNHENL